jgi:hypothetical protein
MSDDLATLLTKFEWVEHPIARVRMKFRRDSTGFYEREASDTARFVRDNLLYRVEETVLHIKFARARGWTQVGIAWREGRVPPDARIGKWEILIERDPYAWMMEEHETPSLLLYSDSGAALLG